MSTPTIQRPGKVTEHTSKHGTVTVTEETVDTDWAGALVVRYVVTTPAGFRATLPACCRDDCVTGGLKPCPGVSHNGMRRAESDAHDREVCHGTHAPAAERFALEVLKTMGTKPARKQPTLPGVTSYMRNSRGRVLVDCPAWPAPVEKPLPPPCDCESCATTKAQFKAVA